MRASPSTIPQRAIDLVDALHGIVDVAFAHDLAVSFADLGIHDHAMTLATTLEARLVAIVEDLDVMHSAGPMAALFESLAPSAESLFELLFESASHLNNRALVAVLGAQRPIDLAVSHLRSAARLGMQTQTDRHETTHVRRSVEALIADLHSFEELLRVLDPREATAEVTRVAAK